MWIPKVHTPIALALLLTSCGAATASSSDESTAASTPHASTAPVSTAPASTAVDTTTAFQGISDTDAAFPARLAVSAKDGKVITFSAGADPIVTAGASSPTGEVVVSSDTFGGRSTIEWHSLRNDQIVASVQIDGEVRPTAIAQDGKLVALTGIVGNQTTVVLATPSGGEMRRWTFDALLVPEAFANAYEPGGDGLPIGVFVIEYLASDTYRVRVIDTATGELGLPLSLRDKGQTVDEVMTAVSRTAVFEPRNQLLFTLYQDATEGGENVGSFIHTLGLVNGVWCLDVPSDLGLADHPGALAVTPNGTRLFAASSTGGVAGYNVADITTVGPVMPQASATASLDSSAVSVAAGASDDELVVALGGSIYRLDPFTLAVRDSFTWDMSVQALTVLDDASIVIVGSGRMTLVSADNQLLAERILPISDAEITRVAVID
jgi:hypothetical protein